MDSKAQKPLRLVGDNVVPLTAANVSPQTLEKVLKHLQKNDDLFDYNVPPPWRVPSQEGLQEFLVRTYRPRTVEITDEASVKKYLCCYDFVEYNASAGPGFKYEFYLKPGMKGVIKKVDLERERPVTVLWEPCAEYPQEKTLDHDGADLVLLPTVVFRKEKIKSKVELLSAASPGRLVEPKNVISKYSYYLPVGTRGIVTAVDSSKEFPISAVFGNTEGYIPYYSGIIECKYNGLKLFRENRIDIRKLIKELS